MNNPNENLIAQQNAEQETSIILHYVHDPMCAWCWCFRGVWLELQTLLAEQLPQIYINYLVGGLAVDSNVPMPLELQKKIQNNWHRIHQHYSTDFNFDFWRVNVPRRSTYPACRAILAAKSMKNSTEEIKAIEQAMIYQIQQAYYLQAKNPSDLSVLTECAGAIGLNEQSFSKRIQSKEIDDELKQNIQFSRQIGGDSFPSLIVENTEKNQIMIMPNHYQDAKFLLTNINASILEN